MKKAVCEFASRFNATQATCDWLRSINLAAETYLGSNPKREGAGHLKYARRAAGLAQKAIEQGDAEGAAMFSLAALQALWQAEITEGRMLIDLGVKRYRKAEAANAQRSKSTAEDRKRWRALAKEIRADSSRRQSKVEIAKKIDPSRWDTIRRFI